jgi:hypothetical protein
MLWKFLYGEEITRISVAKGAQRKIFEEVIRVFGKTLEKGIADIVILPLE